MPRAEPRTPALRPSDSAWRANYTVLGRLGRERDPGWRPLQRTKCCAPNRHRQAPSRRGTGSRPVRLLARHLSNLDARCFVRVLHRHAAHTAQDHDRRHGLCSGYVALFRQRLDNHTLTHKLMLLFLAAGSLTGMTIAITRIMQLCHTTPSNSSKYSVVSLRGVEVLADHGVVQHITHDGVCITVPNDLLDLQDDSGATDEHASTPGCYQVARASIFVSRMELQHAVPLTESSAQAKLRSLEQLRTQVARCNNVMPADVVSLHDSMLAAACCIDKPGRLFRVLEIAYRQGDLLDARVRLQPLIDISPDTATHSRFSLTAGLWVSIKCLARHECTLAFPSDLLSYKAPSDAWYSDRSPRERPTPVESDAVVLGSSRRRLSDPGPPRRWQSNFVPIGSKVVLDKRLWVLLVYSANWALLKLDQPSAFVPVPESDATSSASLEKSSDDRWEYLMACPCGFLEKAPPSSQSSTSTSTATLGKRTREQEEGVAVSALELLSAAQGITIRKLELDRDELTGCFHVVDGLPMLRATTDLEADQFVRLLRRQSASSPQRNDQDQDAQDDQSHVSKRVCLSMQGRPSYIS